MDTNISKRRAWEKAAAKKCRINWEKNRDFFDLVWETDDIFHTLEEFEDCAEHYLPFYLRARDRVAQRTVAIDLESERGEPEGQDKPEPIAGLSERTGTRIAAFSEYLAKIAACNKRVMRLRDRLCGEVTQTMAREEALRFLEAHSMKGTKVIVGAADTLPWPDGSASGKHFRVQEDSVLAELLDTANYLERHYPWTVDQAANFILCGVIPQAGIVLGKRKKTTGAGVAAHKFERATITLEVDSWISADEVRRAYLHMQRRVHSDDFGGFPLSQGLRKHPSPRNLDVFRFVVGQSTIRVVNGKERLGRLKIPPWRDLMNRWNNQLSANDDPRHYSNVRNFSRDFKRAQRSIIGTDDGLPGIPGMPMSAAKVRAEHKLFVEKLQRQVHGDD